MNCQILNELRTKLPTCLHPLIEIADNFWWSWMPDGSSIFRDLDSQHWENCNHNPIKFLATLSERQLMENGTDPSYLQRLYSLSDRFKHYLAQSPLTAEVAPQITIERPVAYFCIEFGLHQCLANYAGGLGILAGDYLKTASDLGLPMVGVGLLYRQGYFQQYFNVRGWQEEHYPDARFSTLPLKLVLDDRDRALTIRVQIRKRCITAQIWQIHLGRVKLYLLDTDREDNDPLDRRITSRLYEGDEHTRMAQEMLLGIGGVRALQQLNITPSLVHLNEGHSAFALLELIRQTIEDKGQTFEWSHHSDFRERVAFIENYDLLTAQRLVQGVDIWLNTPRRTLEASGTSGQKVSLNGGINCSILDGWWREVYRAEEEVATNGWAIGEDHSIEHRKAQDRQDAESLYHLLESEIIPLYYDRGDEDFSSGWVDMMKASIKTVAPFFNTERMLTEYLHKMY